MAYSQNVLVINLIIVLVLGPALQDSICNTVRINFMFSKQHYIYFVCVLQR